MPRENRVLALVSIVVVVLIVSAALVCGWLGIIDRNAAFGGIITGFTGLIAALAYFENFQLRDFFRWLSRKPIFVRLVQFIVVFAALDFAGSVGVGRASTLLHVSEQGKATTHHPLYRFLDHLDQIYTPWVHLTMLPMVVVLLCSVRRANQQNDDFQRLQDLNQFDLAELRENERRRAEAAVAIATQLAIAFVAQSPTPIEPEQATPNDAESTDGVKVSDDKSAKRRRANRRRRR